MTTRWPSALIPSSCVFGRTRNPAEQTSQTDLQHYAPSRPGSRALWMAECSWELQPALQRQLRSVLDAMDGQRTYYLIWDFANPYPSLDPTNRAISADEKHYWAGTSVVWKWKGTASNRPLWTRATVNYTAFNGSLAISGSYNAGSTSFSVSGFPASVIALQRGDFIEIDEHVYCLSDHAYANGSGIAVLSIFSHLAAAISGASTVNVIQPAVKMRLDGSPTWTLSRSWNGAMASAAAKFIEVA